MAGRNGLGRRTVSQSEPFEHAGLTLSNRPAADERSISEIPLRKAATMTRGGGRKGRARCRTSQPAQSMTRLQRPARTLTTIPSSRRGDRNTARENAKRVARHDDLKRMLVGSNDRSPSLEGRPKFFLPHHGPTTPSQVRRRKFGLTAHSLSSPNSIAHHAVTPCGHVLLI